MYLAQRKQSKSMCRYTCIYSRLLTAVYVSLQIHNGTVQVLIQHYCMNRVRQLWCKALLVLSVSSFAEKIDHFRVVMQTAQLGAIQLLSQAVILASQADKLAPGSEMLRPAQAMPQVVQMSDLLDSFKPSENIMKHCLQGPSVILDVYFCILLSRAILQEYFIKDTRR